MSIEKKIEKLRKKFLGYNEVIIVNDEDEGEVLIVAHEDGQTCVGVWTYELFMFFKTKDIFSFSLNQFMNRGFFI